MVVDALFESLTAIVPTPMSIRAAQERLFQLRVLTEADLLAELVDPAGADPVDPTRRTGAPPSARYDVTS